MSSKIALCCVLMLAACGIGTSPSAQKPESPPDAGLPVPATKGEACEEFGEAICQSLVRCQMLPPEAAPDCPPIFSAQCLADEDPDSPTGYLRNRGKQWKDCMDGLANLACDAQELPTACQGF